MLIAGQWYQSGTFWTAAGVAATLLVGIGTVIVAYLSYKASRSRRILRLSLTLIANLGHYLPASDSEIQITKGQTRIGDPQLAGVWLKFTGRSDLSAADWDSGKPVRLDVHAPIVSLVDVRSSPGHYSVPEVRVDGNAIILEPGLIRRGQEIMLTVLVDGTPRLSLDSHLVNVQISIGAPLDFFLPSAEKLVLYSVLLAAAIMASTFLDLAGKAPFAAAILLSLLLIYTEYLYKIIGRHRKNIKVIERQSIPDRALP